MPQQDIRMQGGDEVRQSQAHLPLQAGQLPGHHLPQQGPAVRGNLRDPLDFQPCISMPVILNLFMAAIP